MPKLSVHDTLPGVDRIPTSTTRYAYQQLTMKSTLLLTPAWAGVALAGFDTWSPPGPYDGNGP